MKIYFYIIATTLIRFLLYISPRKKWNPKRIVFTSYLGKQYSCNPKYLSEYIKTYAPEYEQVWGFVNPDDYTYLKTDNIHIVKYNSLKFIRLCMSSKYIITNTRDLTHIPFSSKQCVINTWHGGGAYKKVGFEGINSNLLERYREYLAHKTPYTYVSSSKIFTELTLHRSFHHTGDIIDSGMPRNDILIHPVENNLHNKICSKYAIPLEHKILLYAPTFRKDRKISDYAFDVEQIKNALTYRFGGKWTILFRAHYYIAEQLVKQIPDYINVSDYPDMQDLLSISDILITDYSSSIWDFSFTKRPCFLYATDLSEYDLANGFYTDISSWPFPLAQNMNELTQHILNFDHDIYIESILQHHKNLGSYETGDACKKILSYIKNF